MYAMYMYKEMKIMRINEAVDHLSLNKRWIKFYEEKNIN